MQERKLATIRKIAEVRAIEGADAIEACRVGGWWVVCKKGEFQVDQVALYLEIDSWVPTELAPFLSRGNQPREFEGVKGERLRTIKLKGQLSQGLLLPIPEDTIKGAGILIAEGLDLTDHLGILKYEKPIPVQLAGLVKGNFPSFIPKTDQPRIQNLSDILEELSDPLHGWSVTEKIDGSSMTVFVNGEESGVCSRNLELKYDPNNSFWEAAIKYDIINKINKTGRNLAIQGELFGEGIQGNAYKISGRKFYCFDIWDIDNQKYLMTKDMFDICDALDIESVPLLEYDISINKDIEKLILEADGKSVIGAKPDREGVVYQSNRVHDLSFKSISAKWLLKNDN